ncbi:MULTISPECIES: alpha/beta hydrolase [unclassified Brevundimonas]|uniref:alpha/beta hydrolase n=1 Tax=unclassified Brevundimonas TaxID=2622653 RepID=UPI003F8E376A
MLPGVAFAAPDGPFSFDQGGSGRQWFSVAGVTPADRAERIVAARPAFDSVLEGLIAAHGLSDRPERVALVGFSQGRIMALDAVVSGRWRVGCVVGFSGRLASPTPWLPTTTPVLLIHGTADAVIPSAEGQAAAAAALAELGAPVETVWVEGGGHEVQAAGAAAAGRFLAKTLGETADRRRRLSPPPLPFAGQGGAGGSGPDRGRAGGLTL